ncbi:TonB-dependent receptor [Sphingomonas sp.]|uniref:TonB-dependent receptor n=1 Tax=Sphingomonas sp. TaxID=28214 RepID=UPI001823E02E|nr:TonB-dependent receptor [Sphingomonas sp.]MBA4761804.1 TonB-dependent receptor [Sphingomonas sp.]
MKQLLMSSVATAVLLSGATAHAADPAHVASQSETTPAKKDPEADRTGIEEVIVTAQRTETSLQRTPVSVQAYSAEELTRRGVSDIASLVQNDSSVNLNLSTGQPIIAVRGVSSQNATEVGDPAVSVATDGIFTNRPYGIFASIYDVARVEILRGPQGTLFGRNATGGTINVITARPTDGNEAMLTGEVGSYSLVGAEGYVNFGVAKGVNGRISFNLRNRNGYRDLTPNKTRGDDEDLKSIRAQLAFESGALEGWILGQYSHLGGGGAVRETLPFIFRNGVSGEPVHELHPNISDGRTFPAYVPYVRDMRHWELRGGLTYTFADDISISYLGGYDRINYLRQQAISPFFAGFGNGPLPVPRVYDSREKPETINQEIRIASAPNARFSWQAGAYYFRENSSVFVDIVFNPNSNARRLGTQFQYPSITSTSKALFAQASYGLTEELRLTVGGRYTWDNKERIGTFILHPAQTGAPNIIRIDQPASSKSNKPTWTVGLDYQATPDNLLYAKVSTGYKVGGFNNAVSVYGPETVTSYEIGSKNSFFDRHLQLNVSAFRMDYADQQVTQFVAGVQSSGSLTVNAGRSRIWGAELNLIAQDDAFGRVAISGNFTDAKYKEFMASAGWNSSINLNLAGNTLPLAPRWSFTGEYMLPIELSSGATVTPRISGKYQSDQWFAATNYNSQKNPAYGLVDLGLDYETSDGNVLVQLWVKNLFDKTVFSDATEFYLYNNYQYSYQPPRTYGIRARVKIR